MDCISSANVKTIAMYKYLSNATVNSLTAAPPAAEPSSASAESADRATAFVAVDSTEQFNGSTLLVAAYIALWAILMAWLWLLWSKNRGLTARLDALEHALHSGASAPPSSLRTTATTTKTEGVQP